MNDKRVTQRIVCICKCVLYHGEIKYPCLLENISINGALINLMSKPNAVIRPGDSCCLIIGRDPSVCSSTHTGKVIRRHLSQIGLQFDRGEDKAMSSYCNNTHNFNRVACAG